MNSKCNCKRMEVADVNAHLHTPYSFSAFARLSDALDQAAQEGVKVVGINDFYSLDGYAEWKREALKRKLYPMFNIEFISLNAEDQQAGVRVNDPNNPGRTYLSGKGLAYPVILEGECAEQLAEVRGESNAHVQRMCGKMNEILDKIGAGFRLNFGEIERELTKGSIRERHLAKALRMKVAEKFGDDRAAMADFYETVFNGKPLKSSLDNPAAVENEIRGNLLKAGGGAFVPEDPKAFLPMETVKKIILAAGGIPTYPFLADDAKGGFTDFEGDLEKCAETLRKRGIWSVEFITTRNSVEVLEKYAGYLHDRGFVVTFGTEHNTPAMEPVKLSARGGAELTERLKYINYCGACVVAAHQDLVEHGEKGYVDAEGHADTEHRDEFIVRGDRVIKSVIA
ncbi:MAG: hypothetical protein J6K95_08155 [Rikenellaceae bacterium]|nr:hypothetical protein [Rikenellaceae bacterium]